MPIPDFQAAMLPVLRLAADGRDHTVPEAVLVVARLFQVTDQERKEMLPSGRQRRLHNRVAWAKAHLQKSGLLEANGRGRFRITLRGQEVLKTNPAALSMKSLAQLGEEVAPVDAHADSADSADSADAAARPVGIDAGETAKELLEQSCQELRRRVAEELLDRINSCSPRLFEKLVVDLLSAMGYRGARLEAGRSLGQRGDEAVQCVIEEDPLGLDRVFVQANRGNATVGRPAVQTFAASLEGRRARKGVLITTSDFSSEAHEYARHAPPRIVLVDGAALAGFMIDYRVGVSEVATYAVTKLDLEYFAEKK